jgi:hypothetical protein
MNLFRADFPQPPLSAAKSPEQRQHELTEATPTAYTSHQPSVASIIAIGSVDYCDPGDMTIVTAA